ncbi:MAG: glycosyltransferase family 39 protein [Acidimicrobiia bacterium]|nr:glycosyltransferase family 39 protein [Acidimicrobiia bacterium]
MTTRAPSALRDVRWLLVAIAVVGLAIRLVAVQVWSTDLPLEGDQVFYHHQGHDLAEWVGYTYRHPAGERITTAVHPPLHGSLLGGASLVGVDSVDGHRGVGALLGAGTVLVGGLAARRLAGDRAGLAAAGLLAVTPTLWINDSLVLSESSYAFAIAVFLLAAAEFAARPDGRHALLLGAAVGLALLARAEAALLCVVAIVPMVWLARNRRAPGGGPRQLPTTAGGASGQDRTSGGVRRSAMLLAVAGAGTLVVAGPWLVRNLTTFERPVTVSSGAGFVLEIANCDATYHGDQLGWWSTECDRTPWQPGDETATEAAKRATGVAYMRDHADRLPAVVAARVARMWDVWRPGQSVVLNDVFERRGRATSQAAIVVWWSLLPLAAAGGWLLRRRWEVLVPYAAIALTTTVAAAMSFGITRYRTGLEVAVAVLAGVALAGAADWVVRRRRRDVAGSAAHSESAVERARVGP